jgi:uncharacterized protein
MEFVGRAAELAMLRDAFDAQESAFIPIYGRRRVGKSELILHFLGSRRGLYFVGKQAPAALQKREFLREAAVTLDDSLLADAALPDWKSILSTVVSRWKRPEKLVLALDEFQWMAGASPELPSVLQELWDREWKRNGRVVLLLCGSYIGFMEREVLGKKSPLFGRRTAQILLKPFGYRDAARFHPGYSATERARAYFVCGGVPWYLRSFSDEHSVEGNIMRQLLDDHGPLRHEPEFLLREELREVDRYYAVLLAIAGAANTAAEIARQSGIGNRALHYYLDQLVGLGYVHKRFPLTGTRPAARHVRFYLADPMLRFWFRFIFPNTSYLAHMGPERTFRERIRPDLDAYFGGGFEALCREALPTHYARKRVTGTFEVGEYWDKHVQIDVVGRRSDGVVDLGECKWGRVRSAKGLIQELAEKRAAYPNEGGDTIRLHAFTRDRVTDQRRNDGIVWHDLATLYQ